MRSLNPDTDSRTTKTGKEGFTLKANQKEENLNGCAALTKTESEGIDTDIEALESYICENICQYREKTDSQEALEYYFCSSCEMSRYASKIKAEYDRINCFGHSQAAKLINKYKKTSCSAKNARTDGTHSRMRQAIVAAAGYAEP